MASKDEQIEFSTFIEKRVRENRMSYMDAIISHCEETGFEVELAALLLTPPLKSKISDEAQELNMIKKVRALPI